MIMTPKELYQHRLESQRLWRERWPQHCPKCKGWGILEWTENQAPPGSSKYRRTTIREQCSCLERGICPRCGQQDVAFTEISDDTLCNCRACGWDGGQPDGEPKMYYWERPEPEKP